jgi:hypothetical protein
VGRPIPIFIGVQHDPNQSTTREQPLIELKSLSVTLEAMTSVRGLTEGLIIGDKYQPASHSSWVKTVSLGDLSTNLKLTSTIDMREHLNLTVPEGFTPSFSTFNVARNYALRVKATVECAKEKFKAQFSIEPFDLLSDHMIDSVDPPTFETNGQWAQEEERLPTWEESGGRENTVPQEKEKEDAPPGYESRYA